MTWRSKWPLWACVWLGPVALVQPAWAWWGHGQVVPFTTFQDEQQAILTGLPCKWLAMDTLVQNRRVDLVCKGGDWATVTLLLERGPQENSLSRVRLLYRNMNPDVQLGAAEAHVAQRFLSHVVARLVPVGDAGEVLAAFWGNDARSWQGQGVRVSVRQERRPTFRLQELEIQGLGQDLTPSLGLTSRSIPGRLPARVSPPSAPAASPSAQFPTAAAKVASPTLASTPAPARASGGVVKLPSPTAQSTGGATGGLALPPELRTQPAPESKARPTPPPMPPAALVPSPTASGRPTAPSNFAAYNKAEELTRDIEQRAFGTPRAPRITVAGELQEALNQLPPSPTVRPTKVPTTSPITPAASVGGAPASALDAGEGLGIASGPSPSRVPDPRFAPRRPLPQLEFIPKAEPLPTDNEVIRFEDEASAL